MTDRLLLALTLLVCTVSMRLVSAADFTVDDDGPPADFISIRDALKVAQGGDTIFVSDGAYEETLVIKSDKAGVILEGDGDAIIQGTPKKASVITIKEADDVEIRGFTIQGSVIGIRIVKSLDWVIEDNIIGGQSGGDGAEAANRRHGIVVKGCSGGEILTNEISNNGWDGIRVIKSDNITVDENTVSENGNAGIVLKKSTDCFITFNTVEDNKRQGIRLSRGANFNEVSDNSVDRNGVPQSPQKRLRKPSSGIVLGSATDNSVLSNAVTQNGGNGIRLMKCVDNDVSDNEVEENGNAGISLERSKTNILDGNTTTHNKSAGLRLVGSKENDISDMTASSNRVDGMRFNRSDQNTIFFSTIQFNSAYGVRLRKGSDENDFSINLIESNVKGNILDEGKLNNVADNSPPTITSAPITTGTQGQQYTYNVVAADPNVNDVLVFSLTQFPTGMSIDPTSGKTTWTPTNEQVGTNPVTVKVTDRVGAFDTQSFDVVVANVNDPPQITSAAITFALLDQPYNYDVEADDPDLIHGDVLTFSLTQNPAGMIINTATGLITWIPNNTQLGDNAVTVRVDDLALASATQSFNLFVSDVNNRPQVVSSPVLTATEDRLYSYDVDGFDVDEINGDILTYSLTQNPNGMVIDPSTGIITWTPTNDDVGTVSVTVKVDDLYGLSNTQSFDISVENVNDPPDITSTPVTTAAEDSPYTYDVDATDPDPTGDVLTFSLTQKPDGMTINSSTGVISWTPTNEQVGPKAVTVKVEDPSAAFGTQSFNIEVTNVNDPPQITSTPVRTARAGELYTYSVQATDPDSIHGDTLEFSLTQSPDGMTINAPTGVISWTPTDAQVGKQNVTVRVRDGEQATDTQSFDVTVDKRVIGQGKK